MNDAIKDFARLPVSSLDVSYRAGRCLEEGGFATLGDIMFAPDSALHRVRGMGRKTVAEVRAAGKKAWAEHEAIPDELMAEAAMTIELLRDSANWFGAEWQIIIAKAFLALREGVPAGSKLEPVE